MWWFVLGLEECLKTEFPQLQELDKHTDKNEAIAQLSLHEVSLKMVKS